ASMRRLNVAHIEVVVREDGATDRADQNGLVLDLEFVDGFREQLVRDTMAASGAEVCLMLKVLFALVGLVEDLRLGMNDLVVVFNEVMHGSTSPLRPGTAQI